MTTTESAAPTLSDIWNDVMDEFSMYEFVAGNPRPCGEDHPVVVSASAVAGAYRQWVTREPIIGRPWRDPLEFFDQLDERLDEGTGRPRSKDEARAQIALIGAVCEQIQRAHDELREDIDLRASLRMPTFKRLRLRVLAAARVLHGPQLPAEFAVSNADDVRELCDALLGVEPPSAEPQPAPPAPQGRIPRGSKQAYIDRELENLAARAHAHGAVQEFQGRSADDLKNEIETTFRGLGVTNYTVSKSQIHKSPTWQMSQKCRDGATKPRTIVHSDMVDDMPARQPWSDSY